MMCGCNSDVQMAESRERLADDRHGVSVGGVVAWSHLPSFRRRSICVRPHSTHLLSHITPTPCDVQGAQIGCRALPCDKNKRKCCKYALVRAAASPAHSSCVLQSVQVTSPNERKKEKKKGDIFGKGSWEEEKALHFNPRGMQVFMSMQDTRSLLWTTGVAFELANAMCSDRIRDSIRAWSYDVLLSQRMLILYHNTNSFKLQQNPSVHDEED
jgi:hypothetical protein